MPYKNLLVHLDETSASAARADAALEFARRQGAHLTGLGLVIEPVIPSFVYAQVPAEVLAERRKVVQDETEAILADFKQKAARLGVACDTRLDNCLQPDAPRTVGVHARYADLLILGQPDSSDSPLSGRHLAEEVVLASGRPVLVIPYIGVNGTLGERVVIAWDAGREAARAVNDSLPVLEQAKEVTVVAINARASADGHGPEPGADIALHLARHGCQVKVERLESHEIGIGDTLLSYLADRSADMVVMGAYGHARLRELILGGMTQHMLAHMTVPALMSH